MAVQLNHTIVRSVDSEASAAFLAEVLGLGPPVRSGPFVQIGTANGVELDFMDEDGPVTAQHYAFLLSEEEFDGAFGRILERGLDHWADPSQSRAGEINRNDGGRGVYFEDPSGHLLEIITRPYGSGG